MVRQVLKCWDDEIVTRNTWEIDNAFISLISFTHSDIHSAPMELPTTQGSTSGSVSGSETPLSSAEPGDGTSNPSNGGVTPSGADPVHLNVVVDWSTSIVWYISIQKVNRYAVDSSLGSQLEIRHFDVQDHSSFGVSSLQSVPQYFHFWKYFFETALCNFFRLNKASKQKCRPFLVRITF